MINKSAKIWNSSAFFLSFFALTCVRIFIKMTVSKGDLLQDQKIYRLLACSWALFSPEILQAGAVKGLSRTKENWRVQDWLLNVLSLSRNPIQNFYSQATNTNTKYTSKSRPYFYYQFLYHREDQWTLGSSHRRGDTRWWPDRLNFPHREKGHTHSAAVAHTWNKPQHQNEDLVCEQHIKDCSSV